jgi:hypothetical protein
MSDILSNPRRALSAAAIAHARAPDDLVVLEVLCRAAVTYTKARDGLAAKSPTPTGSNPRNDPGRVIAPFGRQKGQYLDDIPDRDLRWLRGAVADSVEDPAKERWRGQNAELLAAIDAVLEDRGAA